jgi:hypothetical protein
MESVSIRLEVIVVKNVMLASSMMIRPADVWVSFTVYIILIYIIHKKMRPSEIKLLLEFECIPLCRTHGCVKQNRSEFYA